MHRSTKLSSRLSLLSSYLLTLQSVCVFSSSCWNVHVSPDSVTERRGDGEEEDGRGAAGALPGTPRHGAGGPARL